MTAQEVRLCGLLLREHFGEVVEKIGVHLLRSGTLNLRALAHETSTPLDLVTLAFLIIHVCCVLIWFTVLNLFNHTHITLHMWFFWIIPSHFTDQAHLNYRIILFYG